jgi:hypothetical protein
VHFNNCTTTMFEQGDMWELNWETRLRVEILRCRHGGRHIHNWTLLQHLAIDQVSGWRK